MDEKFILGEWEGYYEYGSTHIHDGLAGVRVSFEMNIQNFDDGKIKGFVLDDETKDTDGKIPIRGIIDNDFISFYKYYPDRQEGVLLHYTGYMEKGTSIKGIWEIKDQQEAVLGKGKWFVQRAKIKNNTQNKQSFFARLFSKNIECPIKEADRIWIESNLRWIHEKIVKLDAKLTILPTPEFFNWKFTGKEQDAEFLLKRMGEIFGVDTSSIKLMFFEEKAHDYGGGIYSRFDESEKHKAGLYERTKKNETTISISLYILPDTVSLISVIAHELCHYVLMNLHDVYLENEKHEEYLTELLVVAFGLGVFQGNSSTTGYFPNPITAYAMAFIEYEFKGNKNHVAWEKYMNPTLRKLFYKSMKYLTLENI